MSTKRPSRREALRAFNSEPKRPYDGRCRRMTQAELEMRKTAAEVAAEFRWAESLRGVVDELAEFRGSGRRVD